MRCTPLSNFFSSLDHLSAVAYDFSLHLTAIRLVRFVSSRYDSSGDRIAGSNGLPIAAAAAAAAPALPSGYISELETFVIVARRGDMSA